MNIVPWQDVVVALILLAAAASLVRRAWHALGGARRPSSSACDHCASSGRITLTKD
jgi:hypothetical protein